MSFAVSTEGLVKRYGASRALDGFSLSVPRGSVTGLVGSNGAGKTTWMMTVAGFVVPDSGSVDVLGGGPFDASVHSGRVSILPQDSELPPESRGPRTLSIGNACRILSPSASSAMSCSIRSSWTGNMPFTRVRRMDLSRLGMPAE